MSPLCLFVILALIKQSFQHKCLTPKRYDYIVIGAGTAGSIVASELSKTYLVLLIEEGGWSKQWSIINDASNPFATFFEPQIERGYISEPQPNLNNRIFQILRAKITGGCNSHNVLQYVLGQRTDFDERWNVNNWKWDDLKDIWNYIDTTFKHTVIEPDSIWNRRFIEAAEHNSFMFSSNPNDLSNVSGDIVSVKTAMGEIVDNYALRETSWTAYIEAIIKNRLNLHIMVYTRVNKILFKTKSRKGQMLSKPISIGVETFGVNDNRITNFYARKEVILCAGAIDTPKILMLSGIGDCAYLSSLNIECVVNVPGVGKNLEDHLQNQISSPPLKNQETDLPVRLFPIYGTIAVREEGTYQIGLDISDRSTDGLIRIHSLIGLFQLKSRGEVLLNDNNPESKPIINPKYFSNTIDEEIWIRAFNESRNLLYNDILMPFYDENEDELLPGYGVNTENEILDWGRKTLTSFGHFASSCRMGNEFNDDNLNEIVVNNKLKVRGIEALRIVDLSIAPHATSANTNQVTMLIGFKGSQIILNDVQPYVT